MPYEKLKLMVAPSGNIYLGTIGNNHEMSDVRRKFTDETLQASAEYWGHQLDNEPTTYIMGKTYTASSEPDTPLVIMAAKLTKPEKDKLFTFLADLTKAHKKEDA